MWYWTRFTMRMMVRVVLLTALMSWWLTQTLIVQGGKTFGSTSLGFFAHADGWSTTLGSSGTQSWWWRVADLPEGRTPEGSSIAEAFKHAWSLEAQIIPGVDYRRQKSSRMLHFKHWLICLPLLITTLATSVRWMQKKMDEGHSDA